MARADGNTHAGSNHPDYVRPDGAEASDVVSARYQEALGYVVSSRTHTEYTRRRLETGIAKPSIFSGLPRILSLPGCFGADLMHLLTLNLTDLMISHFRGTMPCDPTDDRDNWPWAALKSPAVWHAHGKLVQDATLYLPGSFDRPPRNPAEKISSGYKAWEFQTYFFGFLPGFLWGVLAAPYYLHFCKLVYGVLIMIQHSIPFSQIRSADHALLEFVTDYERLYYARRLDRLHFVRQSIHALIHIAPEALRLGPGSLYTQWTLENYIGNITREIKQHVTPYTNVSERALRRTRINALQAMIPAFATDESPPLSSIDLHDGYRLLRARDRGMFTLTARAEQHALRTFLIAHNIPIDPGYQPSVQRWARLHLPNGQNTRSLWKEGPTEARGGNCRRARMVKVRNSFIQVHHMVIYTCCVHKLTNNRFAEVQYYFLFQMPTGLRVFAMVSYFSEPDPDILDASYHVLLVCRYAGHLSRAVIDVKMIAAAVAMVPLPLSEAEAQDAGSAEHYATRFFVVEKPGLAVAVMGGFAERMDGLEDDDVDNEDE
ncbi:hypothetical protein TRAPUB_10962 [Trametes pubescens]|uniref:Uncharacterized protein n=1 Tax=Trametes pubescens TaxID=154538 RepID=A0A1M2VY16_TRAPU|nr:hypothetical protein TRAPUB_10962 [Trametes pubescens]